MLDNIENSTLLMKKIATLLLFALTLPIAAQKNEIKIDVFDVIALKSVDATFERIINFESSVGVSILFNFEKESSSFRYNEEFVLTPYYRQVLFSRGNIDYFGEFFGAINTGKVPIEDLEIGDDDTYTDFALGLSFGGKYVSSSGFVADFHIGVGRNLFNTNPSPEVVPRVGIALGKQF